MNYELLDKSSQQVRQRLTQAKPSLCLMLDAGWQDVLNHFKVLQRIPFSEIPALSSATQSIPMGELVLAELNGNQVLVFKGRRHYYEGNGWSSVAFPVYLCRQMGLKSLVLSDSAGGIGSEFKPGEIMLVRDHINCMGSNPLFGPYNDFWGSPFPEMSRVYDSNLRKLLKKAATLSAISVPEGVLCAFSGPSYETPAEVAMAESFGADAVAMSVVPEAILAHACGLKVAAFCCISNFASGLGPIPFSHHSVFATVDETLPKITLLLEHFVELVAKET